MTEQKRNRMIAAITVNVILLIVILVAVVIYQLVDISLYSKRRNDMKKQINYYVTETDKIEDNLEYYKSAEHLEDLAYKYGFIYGH